MQYSEFTLTRPDTGAVLPFCTCTVYLSDGVTKASLFNAVGGSIGNPVTADANGKVGFAVANGNYKLAAISADSSLTVPQIYVQIFDLAAIGAGNVVLTGDGTASGPATGTPLTVKGLNGVNLASLATGILKNTTSTGVPSIAVAGDFPTLNQNTTGSAATLTTARNITMTGDVTWTVGFNGSADVTAASAIGVNKVGLTQMAQVATATFLGRATGGTGNVEAMRPVDATALLNVFTLSAKGLVPSPGTTTGLFLRDDGTWAAAAAGSSSFTLTGDVTGTGAGTVTTTIAAASVTLAKMANLAANSIIGNNTGSPAVPLALSGTQVTAMLDAFTSTLKGVVPASGGGTTNFLRADGTWAAPPGGAGTGTVTSVSITTANGVSGSVATATTTPAITLTLGAITPSSVAATGAVSGSNLSGTNTGDQTSSNVSWSQTGTGAIAATVNDKLGQIYSVLDIIPKSYWSAIASQTSTVDVSAYIIQAVANLAGLANGGRLYFPRGRYYCTSQLSLSKQVSWFGDGGQASKIFFPSSYTGHGVRQANTLNAGGYWGSTVEDMGIESGVSSWGSTVAGGLYNTGANQCLFKNVLFKGWAYGAILDQSELIDFDFCEFNSNVVAAWLVNGATTSLGNTGAAGGYTNRIGFDRTQFNANTGTVILDDGGEQMSVTRCNFNSGAMLMRCSGRTTLLVKDNYIEACSNGTNPYFRLDYQSLDGRSVGAPSCVEISNNNIGFSYAVPLVSIYSGGRVVLNSNNIAGSSPAVVYGAGNAYGIFTDGGNVTSRAMLDQEPGTLSDVRENVKNYTATYAPPSLAAGASGTIQTMTATGVKLGDVVEAVSFSNNAAGVDFKAWVSAADTISYYAQNVNGANPTALASGTLRVRVRKLVA